MGISNISSSSSSILGLVSSGRIEFKHKDPSNFIDAADWFSEQSLDPMNFFNELQVEGRTVLGCIGSSTINEFYLVQSQNQIFAIYQYPRLGPSHFSAISLVIFLRRA